MKVNRSISQRRPLRVTFLANASSPHLRYWLELAKYWPEVELSIVTATHHYNPDLPPWVKSQKTFSTVGKLPTTSLLQAVNQLNPDIVHVHSAGWYGAASLLLRNRTSIITVYGSEVYAYPTASFVYRAVMRRILVRQQGIFVGAPSMKDFIRSHFPGVSPETISLFPIVANPDLFRPRPLAEKKALRAAHGLPVDARILISNRRMMELYNIETVVDAFHQVAAKNPEAHLVLLRGDADPASRYIQGLLQRTQELRLGSRITFLNEFYPPAVLGELLGLADVFISIPDSDQLSLSVVEGIASGCAGIISDLPAYSDYQRSCLWRVADPKDTSALATVIRSALEQVGQKPCGSDGDTIQSAAFHVLDTYFRTLA